MRLILRRTAINLLLSLVLASIGPCPLFARGAMHKVAKLKAKRPKKQPKRDTDIQYYEWKKANSK